MRRGGDGGCDGDEDGGVGVLDEREREDHGAELEGGGVGEGWKSERVFGFGKLRDRLEG